MEIRQWKVNIGISGDSKEEKQCSETELLFWTIIQEHIPKIKEDLNLHIITADEVLRKLI